MPEKLYHRLDCEYVSIQVRFVGHPSSTLLPLGCGAKKTLGMGITGGAPSTSNSNQTLSTPRYSGKEVRPADGEVVHAPPYRIGHQPRRQRARRMETGQAVTPMRCPGEHQEVSPWTFSPRRHSKPNVVCRPGSLAARELRSLCRRIEGEINAGGTLAATGLRYSSNELVFDTLYAIWREARSRNSLPLHQFLVCSALNDAPFNT